MHPLVNIALRAGRDAAGVLAQQSERLDRIRAVETEAGQQVTSVEADADKSLLYHIRSAYPNHHVNSRISGEPRQARRTNLASGSGHRHGQLVIRFPGVWGCDCHRDKQ